MRKNKIKKTDTRHSNSPFMGIINFSALMGIIVSCSMAGIVIVTEVMNILLHFFSLENAIEIGIGIIIGLVAFCAIYTARALYEDNKAKEDNLEK